MFISKWMTSSLLTMFVVLSCETREIEEQLDTCVHVEVNFHRSHKSSELPCEGPEKPSNGGYVSDVIRERYETGDTITYHCNTGHQLIGHVNRTCNGTSKQWEPEEPYCLPEYIGHLMRRLNVIEDHLKVIEQRITSVENNTLQIGYNISVMDNRMTTIDNKVTAMDNRMSAIENNVSAIYNISKMEPLNCQIDRERLAACTNVTKAIDEDTVTKCKTMQSGERNGLSVSVFTWVIEDYKNTVANLKVNNYSQPFYHTVPGYKFRLRGSSWVDSDIWMYLQLLPGEYDDQLKWPFSQRYELTALTNVGLEVRHRSFSGEPSTCQLNRPTSPADFNCGSPNPDPNWEDVRIYMKHILNDGSFVAKLYLYY